LGRIGAGAHDGHRTTVPPNATLPDRPSPHAGDDAMIQPVSLA
jgi:hypothetical protein